MTPTKNVKNMWQITEDKMLRAGLPPAVIAQHRHSFYTGYASMLAAATQMLMASDNDGSIDRSMLACGKLAKEIGEYLQEWKEAGNDDAP